MSLNKEQTEKLGRASYWYNKTAEKISRRYHRGIGQKKEERYARVLVEASEDNEEIDIRFKQVLKGTCSIDHFKQSISDWFFKVKNGWDAVDKEARKAKEPWCDYEDKRPTEDSKE